MPFEADLNPGHFNSGVIINDPGPFQVGRGCFWSVHASAGAFF
jgi:hypothetical protein